MRVSLLLAFVAFVGLVAAQGPMTPGPAFQAATGAPGAGLGVGFGGPGSPQFQGQPGGLFGNVGAPIGGIGGFQQPIQQPIQSIQAPIQTQFPVGAGIQGLGFNTPVTTPFGLGGFTTFPQTQFQPQLQFGQVGQPSVFNDIQGLQFAQPNMLQQAVLPQNFGNPPVMYGTTPAPVLTQQQLQQLIPTAQLQQALNQRVANLNVNVPQGMYGPIQQQQPLQLGQINPVQQAPWTGANILPQQQQPVMAGAMGPFRG